MFKIHIGIIEHFRRNPRQFRFVKSGQNLISTFPIMQYINDKFGSKMDQNLQ
jgi:hypothetical protein